MAEIKVPQMGESITEATVADWHFQPGDSFNSGDIIVELETDKVTMEVPAPEAGTLKEIKKDSGETVSIDEVLAVFEAGAGSGDSGGSAKSESKSEAKSEEKSEASSSSSSTASSSGGGNQSGSGPLNDTVPPGARRLAEEEGVDLSKVTGTGKRGQITKEDVVNYIEQRSSSKSSGGSGSSSDSSKSSGSSKSSDSGPSRPPKQPGERETVVPMSRLRQRIAERLVEAQQTAAILTTFNEVDMHNLMSMRSKYKESFKDKHEVGLGFMSFFVKASIEALKAYPAVNAEIRDGSMVYKNFYDIGVAVGGPKGLVVPVIRDADELSFAGIEQEIGRLAGKVKDGSIGLDDLQGGTFTISNGGIYGSMMSTPILNPPQSGILGMHNITKRPMVIGDEIKIRPMMYVALSYDHRIIDGKEAVSFLVRLKECIENPERMLLDI